MILENFPLLTKSEKYIIDLKKVVLWLAIRGFLSDHNPEDGSGKDILEKVFKERERLYKAKLLRKGKFSSVDEGEIDYCLPRNWALTRMGFPLDLINGKAFKPSDWSENGLPIIRIQNLNNRNAPFNYCDFEVTDKFYVRDGDLLIGWSGTPGTSFGAFIWDRGDAVLNQHIFNAKFISNELNVGFMKLVINANLDAMIEKATGAVGLKHIRKGDFENIPIGIPPLPEQHRIVQKVNTLFQQIDQLAEQSGRAEATREQLRVALLHRLEQAPNRAATTTAWQPLAEQFDLAIRSREDVQAMRQTILQLAVKGALVPQDPGDEPGAELRARILDEKQKLIKQKKIKKPPGNGRIEESGFNLSIPKSWSLMKIIDLAFVTKLAGFEYTKYVNLTDDGEIPVIRAQNVKMNYIDETNLKYIDEETSFQLDRCALDKPAILITFIGAGIGDVAIFNKPKRWHLAPNVAKIEPFNSEGEKVSIQYLQYYLMSPQGQAEIFKSSKATAQPSLSMQTIRDIIIAIPPLPEQRRIVQKVEALLGWCDELEAGLERLEQVEARLVGAAMRV